MIPDNQFYWNVSRKVLYYRSYGRQKSFSIMQYFAVFPAKQDQKITRM